MTSLDKLAIQHGTDKSSLSHNYTPLYERYLGSMRGLTARNIPTLIELGWGGHEDPDAGGGSARMWRDWLPNFAILTVDNEKKNIPADELNGWFQFELGSQADPALVTRIMRHIGNLQVVVDDASHLSSLTIKSFELLWPHLAPGGWYVVEDTHMAYHDFYYGVAEAAPNPSNGGDGTSAQSAFVPTAMGFLKRLADEVNFAGGTGEWDLFPPEYWLGYEVEEIHFHFNICFVKKRG